MKIAVLKESADGETRCSAIPETVKKFSALGASVAVERGAGQGASIADADFEAAGASVGARADVLKGADIILCVHGTGSCVAERRGQGRPAGWRARPVATARGASTAMPPRGSRRWRWN